jgi:hypothetical protein
MSGHIAFSLMKLYMLVNRMLVRAQENQICSTCVIKVWFKIIEHPLFIKVNRVINVALNLTCDSRINVAIENWKGLHMKKREESSIIMKIKPFIHKEWIEFSL